MQDKKIQIYILIGALLLTGLFFYRSATEEHKKSQSLKPSDVNFVSGNYPVETKQSEIFTEKKETPAIDVQPVGPLAGQDQKKWQIFKEILNSKNDNDPRLDNELRNLSPEIHRSLQNAYEKLPSEDRNGRGLIAFLVARDLNTTTDVEFLRKIYQENPCLSFENCSVVAPPDPHVDGVNQTSLNYPQLAGLYQLEQKLKAQPDLLRNPEMKKLISDLLRDARQFPADAIQKRAEAIISQYGL